MSESEWLELADRCEAATGAQDALDEALHAAMGFVLVGPEGDCCWVRGEGRNMQVFYELPGLTGSLDAITRVIEKELVGYDYTVGRKNGGLTTHAQCGSHEISYGATPALALCAAFCRAMAGEAGW